MKGKKIIIFVVLLIILIGVVAVFTNIKKNRTDNTLEQQQLGEFVSLMEDGTKENISEKLKEIKVLEGLEITEISLTEKDNVSQISAKVENSTENSVEGMEVTVVFSDKEGNTITEISAYITDLEPGESTMLYSSVVADVSNAYDVNIVRK